MLYLSMKKLLLITGTILLCTVIYFSSREVTSKTKLLNSLSDADVLNKIDMMILGSDTVIYRHTLSKVVKVYINQNPIISYGVADIDDFVGRQEIMEVQPANVIIGDSYIVQDEYDYLRLLIRPQRFISYNDCVNGVYNR